MVTLASARRQAWQRRAIDAYMAQGWRDRELVVVIDPLEPAAARALKGIVANLGRRDIRIVEPDGAATLGRLRNLAAAAASGDVLMQWDDDDLHHADRIDAQAGALLRSGRPASILADVMLYEEAARRLLWTHWSRTPAGGHPATLACLRGAVTYPERGETSRRGEDLAALLPLAVAGGLHRLEGAPHLYVYSSHDANTAGRAHLRMLADTLAISTGLLRRREKMLRDGLSDHDFGGPVTVEGANGVAFTLA